MSSLLRLEQQQKRFLKIHFEFAYFPFVHSRSSLETIPDSRPKRAKSIPFSDQKRRKDPTLWGGRYLYGLHWEVSPKGLGETSNFTFHPMSINLESWILELFAYGMWNPAQGFRNPVKDRNLESKLFWQGFGTQLLESWILSVDKSRLAWNQES